MEKFSAGSIAGSGTFYLGSDELTTGSDNTSATVNGVITDGSQAGGGGIGGSLVKVGTGTLTLNGINTYTGPTTVVAGILDVNGSIADSAVTLTGGELKGHGTVGSLTLAAGSVVAPGNSIGTLHVAGDLSFGVGSVYQVEANAAAMSDLIDATGTAHLNNAVVQVLAAPGIYAVETDYTIIDSAGIDGTFGAVSVDQNFLAASLVYSADSVELVLRLKDIDFAALANSQNRHLSAQRFAQAASGARSIRPSSPICPTRPISRPRSISFPAKSTPRSALSSSRTAVTFASRSSIACAIPCPAILPVRSAAKAVRAHSAMAWRCGFGPSPTGATPKATSTPPPPGRSFSGVMAGIDTSLGGAFRAGLAGGYTHDDIGVERACEPGDSRAGPYRRLWRMVGWAARIARRLRLRLRQRRRGTHYLVPGPCRPHLPARKISAPTQAFGEVGYAVGSGTISAEPFANLAWVDAEDWLLHRERRRGRVDGWRPWFPT